MKRLDQLAGGLLELILCGVLLTYILYTTYLRRNLLVLPCVLRVTTQTMQISIDSFQRKSGAEGREFFRFAVVCDGVLRIKGWIYWPESEKISRPSARHGKKFVPLVEVDEEIYREIEAKARKVYGANK